MGVGLAGAIGACAWWMAAPASGLPLGPGCGGLGQRDCAPPQQAAECKMPDGGNLLGTTDRNPSNTIPQPRLGERLYPRRADGGLAFGFNDPAFFARNATPRVGLNGAEDVFVHKAVGSELIRLNLHWGWMARTRGWIDWVEADRAYCNSIRSGIAPIMTIFGSPKWTIVGGQRCDGYCFAPPDARYDGELRSFASQVAIRYPESAAIEAWNEPNLHVFWHSPLPGGPGPDPARYTEVLRAVFEGAKSGNPSIPVLGGALADVEVGSHVRGISLGDFLSGMYDAGTQRWMDGLSFHPYPEYPKESGKPDLFHKTFSTVRHLVATRDRPGRRLWPDEIGARLSRTVRPYTEAQQSREMLSYYRELEDMRDVDAVVFHTLIDENEWGWLKPRDDAGRIFPRPVYCAFVDRFGPAATQERIAAQKTESTAPAKKKAKKKKKRATKKKKAKKKRKKARKRKRAARSALALRMDCSKPLSLPSS